MTPRAFMETDCARSGLSPADAKRARFTPLDADEVYEHVGVRVSGYKIPYGNPDGERTDFYRIRFSKPVPYTAPSGTRREMRYKQPGRRAPEAYFPPYDAGWQRALKDRTPIFATEGEKKALRATKDGLLTVALGGVWSFQSKKHQIPLLPSLAEIANGREVTIAFDGDVHTNRNVRDARERFAARLTEHRARVWIVDLPPDLALDDFLEKYGRDEFERLPRHPFDPRSHVAAIRTERRTARSKLDSIAAVVEQDMSATGRFLRTSADELLYFDDSAHRLVALGDRKTVELRAFVNNRYSVNGSQDEFGFVYENLAARTYERGQRAEVHQFARAKLGKGVLYLAASPSEMFRITPRGVARVNNGHSNVFLRVPAQMAPVPTELPKPSRAAFDALLDLPNFAAGREATPQQFRMLFELYLFAILLGAEALPTRPIVTFHGEKGSGKSTVGRAVKRTLEGPAADVSLIDPAKLDGLDAALTSQHVVVLDNVDGKYKGIENRLAVAATGGHLVKRAYYTTNDELRVPVRSFVIATTRQPDSFTRDDVVDRLLYMPTQRRDGTFVPESELLARIDACRLSWWAYVLDVLPAMVGALRAQKQKRVTDLRMADFANVAVQIGPVLGHSPKTVLAALRAAEREKVAFVAEQSLLPDALAKLAASSAWRERGDDWLSPSDVLEALRHVLPEFPIRHPAKLGQQMQTELQAIRQRVLLEAKHDSHAKAWRYRLPFTGANK